MRMGGYGRNVSLRDTISDVVSEALLYDTDEEKALTDNFTKSRAFDSMLDSILNEVDEHISYNLKIFSREATK